jgi:TrmH family RNA methyltransferase
MEKIKNIQKLMKNARYRRERQLFVVEGIRMFREIPEERLVELYYTEEAEQKYLQQEPLFQHCLSQKQAHPVTSSVFRELSGTETPQGILALVRMENRELSELLEPEQLPFLLILENLQDPGNMGTIIRTAEGAGVTGILISNDSVDIYNPKVVRSTMGSLFRMKLFISDNLTADVKRLQENNITVYGAHLDGNAFYDTDLTKPSAFLIGNEGNGLTKDISRLADDLIRIPMLGQVESLNAAVSAAIISYEAFRQRHR